MRELNIQKNKQYATTLYQVVFDSTSVKMSVFLLFSFLLLQPLSLAFASEIPEQEQESSAEVEPIPVADIEEEVEESPVESETEATVAVSETSEEIPEATEDAEPVTAEDGVVPPEDTVVEVPPAENNEAETLNNTASSTDESAPENASEDTGEIIDPTDPINPSEDSEAGQEETASEETLPEDTEEQNNESGDNEEQASSTDEQIATSSEATLVVDHNSSAYEFDTKECASVGDGAFYCSSTQDNAEFIQDGVFAAPDSDGDLEIFIRLNGEENKITSNTVDDGAPYYDALSERIVWHTNYNDRYQIISYDMETAEETKLTSASYNNMEPVAYGDITLWQAWVNNNWEIMMYDGEQVFQLTNNELHDVSPHMRSGYIVWQTQFAEGWQVAVYDQETNHIEYVESEGGAKIENPRFVLVYDSTNEAGDIQTVGYDFDNKQSFTLNSIPAQLPDELPEPDQTGETRALIQNKHSVKGIEIEDQEPVPTGNNASSTTATSSENGIPTLDLTAASTTVASSTSAIVPNASELVIPALPSEVETPEVSHIPDVLIPPMEATSTTEVRQNIRTEL